MRKTSEYVSLGHPDKVADYISSFLLDRYLEQDGLTRFAVEVQIKDEFVTLGGEVTSKANYSPEDIAAFVRSAVNQIGYTSEYQKRWGKENTICGDSPWTKDGTKADLSLNLLARARAVSYIQEHPDCPEVHCAISCRIGSPEILVVFTDKAGNELLSYRENVTPAEVIREFNLQKPRFAEMCRKGLFA